MPLNVEGPDFGQPGVARYAVRFEQRAGRGLDEAADEALGRASMLVMMSLIQPPNPDQS
jgi:hypothetical protein